MLRFVAIGARHCAIICLSLITAFGPTTHALAQTITAPSSFTGDPDNWQTLHSAGDLFDVDPGSITGSMRVTVSVSAGSGAIRINTTTGLTAPDGYTTAQWTSGSATEIAFEGMETALDNALASIQFRGSSGSISSTVTPAGAAYYAETGNFYRYIVSNDVDWTDANTQAGSVANQLNGITGYLASITSQGEMDFVVEKIGGTNPAWVGGSDATSEGTWRWRDPDGTDGDVFWNGAGSANGGAPATADTFHDWCSDQEPNNSSNEDYLQIRFTGGNTSCWNDLSNDGSNSASNDPDGFVAEYDGSSSAVVTTFSNVVPTAVSVARNNPSAQIILNTDFQGCSLTPSFTVIFSENVSNVDAADFEASGAGRPASLSAELPAPVAVTRSRSTARATIIAARSTLFWPQATTFKTAIMQAWPAIALAPAPDLFCRSALSSVPLHEPTLQLVPSAPIISAGAISRN